MDITFETEAGRFNYRVCAVLLDGGRILAMHDERSPYFYLPGGRVKMGERAEDAVLREVREELGIEARILRPLWLCQSFFNEDVAHVDYHELCLYFLLDISGTDLLSRGDRFLGPELRHVRPAAGGILLPPLSEDGDLPPAGAADAADGPGVRRPKNSLMKQ